MLSGYEMIASENCWSFPVWQAGVISKVAAFLWLALKAKVLTCDRLTRRGIRVLSCCYLCGKEYETLDHLLLHWLYARSIWQQANGGLKAPLRDRGAGAHWSFLRWGWLLLAFVRAVFCACSPSIEVGPPPGPPVLSGSVELRLR